MRVAQAIEPGHVVETDRVDDQRVALPAADRMSQPLVRSRCAQVVGVSAAVSVDAAGEVVVFEELDHFSRGVHQLEGSRNREHVRHAGGRAVQRRVVGVERGVRTDGRPIGGEALERPGSQRRWRRIAEAVAGLLPHPDTREIEPAPLRPAATPTTPPR